MSSVWVRVCDIQCDMFRSVMSSVWCENQLASVWLGILGPFWFLEIFWKRDPDFGILGTESSEFQVPFGFWVFFEKGPGFWNIGHWKHGILGPSWFLFFFEKGPGIGRPIFQNPGPFSKKNKNQKGPRIPCFQCPIFQNPGPFSKKKQKPRGTQNSMLSAQYSKIRVPFQKKLKNQKGPGIRSFQCPIFQNPGPFSRNSKTNICRG